MGLGAVFVNQLVSWNEKLHEDLQVMIDKSKAANERRYFGIVFIFPQFLSTRFFALFVEILINII